MEIVEKIKENKVAFGGASVAALGVLGWLAFGFFGIQAAFIDNVVEEDGPVFTASAETVEETPAESIDAEAVADAAQAEATAGSDDGPDPAAAAAIEEAEVAAPEEAADVAAADQPIAVEPAVEEAPAEGPGEIVTLSSGNFSSLDGYSVEGEALVLGNGTSQRFLRFENFVSDNGPDLKVYLRAANGEFVSLGDLTGNIGAQNYEIPADVDLSVFSNVEIWCERFSAGFGVAALS